MKKGRYGFTIVEVLCASSIAILVIGAALAIWLFIECIWHTERIKSDLLGNIQIAMETMKKEAMFSDGNKTLTADSGISFPIAKYDDGGFIELDASGKILWDKTVVYHVYNNSGFYELRKTVFSSRNNRITADQRQEQLESVIEDGDGKLCKAEGEEPKTDVVISKLKNLSFDISPSRPKFDGYGAEVSRSNNVSFGSILLDPGYHTLSFEIAGKNGKSSDYGFGIDSFSISPSGCVNEAEDYISLVHPNGSSGIAGSSGDLITKENMIDYGVWGGNYQLDYGSNSKGDYVILRFYYDSWRETNFDQGSLDNVAVEFTNEDGMGGSSGENDYVLSLEGNENEPIGLTESRTIISDSGDNTTYRVIISFPASGRLASIKFKSGTSAELTIEKAYLSERQSGQDGGTSYPITFNNCDLDPRNSGQGVAQYNGGEGIAIPANNFGWSNWISIDNPPTEEVEYFLGGKEYFITFYIRQLIQDESMSIKYLQGESACSYTWSGDHAITPVWGTSGTEDNNLYEVEEVAVRYVQQGIYTSQIYDTGMDDPQFDKIIWNIKRNNYPDADVKLYIRSNDDKNALSSITWIGPIDTASAVNGNADISAIKGGRYVQFKAEFYSYESGEDSSHQTDDIDDEYDNDEDYDMSCILKDITITWPGQQRVVDVSGYYTLRPSYGKFTVKIDGQYLTKGLEAKITATKASYAGRGDITSSLNTEIEFRNTNK